MPRTNHREHALGRRTRLGALFTQARGHKTVALTDQAAEQRLGLFGELVERTLQDVALLELLDIGLGNLTALEQASDQAGEHPEALKETDAVIGAAQRQAH